MSKFTMNDLHRFIDQSDVHLVNAKKHVTDGNFNAARTEISHAGTLANHVLAVLDEPDLLPTVSPTPP